MSEKYSKSNPAAMWIGIIVGAILMVVGTMWAKSIAEAIHHAQSTTPQDWSHAPAYVSVFGQLGIPINLGETLASLGVLLITLPIIKPFFIAPLMAAIDERNANLEKTFSDAENLRAEMGQLRADYEARLVATEASAREQIQSEVRNAQELRRTLTAEAAEQADRMKEQASQQIEAERARVMSELRGQVVDISLAAATKVVKANMNTDSNRRLVQEFVADLESERATPVAVAAPVATPDMTPSGNIGVYPASTPDLPGSEGPNA